MSYTGNVCVVVLFSPVFFDLLHKALIPAIGQGFFTTVYIQSHCRHRSCPVDTCSPIDKSYLEATIRYRDDSLGEDHRYMLILLSWAFCLDEDRGED